jgi:hypothetical protein
VTAASVSTWDIVQRAFFAAGALLLVVGPALQARAEIRGYRALLDLAADTNLGVATRDYLRVVLEAANPAGFGLLRLIKNAKRYFKLATRFLVALQAFTIAASENNDEAALIRTQLARAATWGVVTCGAVLVLIASTIDLVKAATS